jgi:two-component system nitrate/nitrite response regulator NarL
MVSGSIPVNIVILADDPLVRAGLASSLGDGEISVVAQLPLSGFDDEDIGGIDADIFVIDEGWEDTEAIAIPESVEGLDILRLVDPSVLESGPVNTAGSMISRESLPEAIRIAIHAVVAGWIVLDPLTADNRSMKEAPDIVGQLTEREQEVLELVAEGLTNRGISIKLDISENTVKYHINAILSKLGAQSRTEAVVVAARAGLIPL